MEQDATNATDTAKAEPLAIAMPKWFQDGLDDMDRKRAAMAKLACIAPIVDDALTVFADLNPYATPYEGDITITVWVKHMGRVVEMIRHLRAGGFKMARYSDHIDSKCRMYHLQRDDGAHICLMAYVTGGEGATCKYVEVGKKEVLLYELQCDGEPEKGGAA